jgi:TRAP-type mannitol/chloroaromatic compound transport system permease small subunit
MSEDKLTPTRLVFIPFLITAILFISLYSFVHWLLLLKFGTFETERSTEFYLPILLAAIPVVLVINPRLKLLNLKHKKKINSDGHFFYCFIAVLAIAFSTLSLQGFIQDSMGELTELSQIQQIHHKKATKYYSLKHQPYIDYNKLAVYSFQEVRSESKRKDKLHFEIYIVAPIFNSAGDTNSEKYEAWIGKSYHDYVFDEESDEFKVKAFDEFYNASLEHFHRNPFQEITFFERITHKKEFFEKAARSTLKAKYPPIIMDAHYTQFQNRTKGGIELFGVIFVLSIGTKFFMIHDKSFEQKELNRFLKIPENPDDASLKNKGYKWRRRQKRQQNL